MKEKLVILIIDDNIDDRSLCQRELLKAFGDNGLKLMEAGSGENGLESIEKNRPDCVLLDYSLPGRNGIEVLKRIRAKHPYLPVIMLTGHGNEGVAVESMKEGAQDYITKSYISADRLQRLIHVAIEHGELQKRIQEQMASLEIFTRALAHDLKEPMRTISSFTELILQNKHSPEKVEVYFNHIQNATARMTMLIDTVFLYTQMDAHEHMLKESFDMNTLLKETKDNLAHLINECGVEVNIGNLPRVHANRVQVLQVCQNLIANAIRHGGMKVKIDITADEHQDYWQFSVRDNGPGIEPEYHNKIFMPFKRLSGAKEEGAGLGLAICKKAIDLHGGEIWCKSEPGAGATFIFTLPKNRPECAETSIFESELADKPRIADDSKLANILLVDDRESDLEITRIILLDNARLQCNMMVAKDGNEALELLRREMVEGREIDLILLDINMPGMDGFEMLENMRKDKNLCNISVIMCTGSSYDKDKQRSKALGAIGYMIKPVSFENMKPILEHVPNVSLCETGDGYLLQRVKTG